MNTRPFFLSFAVLHVLLLFVFLLIPDLGTVLVLGATGLIMCWYAGARARSLLALTLLGCVSALLVGLVASMTTSKFTYIQERVLYYLGVSEDEENRAIGWQNEQALIAIGGG